MIDLSKLDKDIQKLVIARDVLTSYFSRSDIKVQESEYRAVQLACNYISEQLKIGKTD